MTSPFLTFIDLIYPILFGGVVIALLFFIKKAENDLTKFTFSIFGIVTFESSMRKVWIVRCFLILFALSLVSISGFRDYARFFPTHMQMEVFFDDDGIQQALEEFTREDLADLPIVENWRVEKVEYVSSLNKVLERIKHPFRFDVKKGSVRSRGENYVEVEKLETWGWQKYHIEAGRGSVDHTYELPGQSPHKISSTFELLETDANNFQLSLYEIYWHWKKVIKPEYKQKFSLSPKEEFYSHNLIALTKVRFFPYLDIGKTVYLAKQGSTEKYLPVGYAIYYPD